MVVLVSCVSLDHDADFLPHFVPYYRARGVDDVRLVLHSRARIPRQSVPANVDKYVCWTGEFNPSEKIRRLTDLMYGADVYVSVDVDEFAGIDDVMETWRKYDAPCVYGKMVDRFASRPGVTGPLSPDGDLFSQFPVVASNYSRNVIGMRQPWRPFLLPGPPAKMHRFPGLGFKKWCRRCGRPPVLHHFKWTHQRIDKAKERSVHGGARGRNSRSLLRRARHG